MEEPFYREKSREDPLCRDAFLRDALLGAKREMSRAKDPESMMTIFMLTAMGGIGTARAFALFIDLKNSDKTLVGRGLSESEILTLEKNQSGIFEKFFSDSIRGESPLFSDIRMIPPEKIESSAFFPEETEAVIEWVDDNGYRGVAGFGKPLDGTPADEIRQKFITDLARNMIFCMNRYLLRLSVKELEESLSQKNRELRDTVKKADHSRKMLDRRVFHLNCLNDLTRELIGHKDVNRILDNFLLTLSGTFSLKKAYIVMFDSAETKIHRSLRGIHKGVFEASSEKETGKAIRHFSEVFRQKGVSPETTRVVRERKIMNDPFLPVDLPLGLLIRVTDECFGILGLGDKITEDPFSEEDLSLLSALSNSLIVHLNNALSFETIQRLNSDLENRNAELNGMISDLTTSRKRIEMLENAKDRVRSLLQGQAEKSAGVSFTDIFLVTMTGILLGLIFNFANPSGIEIITDPWSDGPVPGISLLPARDRHQSGLAVIVDARPAEFYEQKHIENAINIPPALFDFIYMMKFGNMDTDLQIIVYGRNISRRYDEMVAAKFLNRGHVKVFILEGGLPAWEKNGHPVTGTSES